MPTGNITVLPGIDRVKAKTVTFTDGSERPFDAIILATGYRPGLAPVLGPDLSARILNERGYPRQLWFDEPALDGLYFLGFTTPLTGIIYNLTIDSDKIARHVVKNNFVPA